MKVDITNRDLQRRFGASVMDVPEDTANKWIRDNWAKPHAKRHTKQMNAMGINTNELDLAPLKSKRKTATRSLVAWVQDEPRRQYAIGAEFSNMTVINVGKKLGFNCKIVTQREFDTKVLSEADFVVLNNISAFSHEQMDDLLMILFERERPFVRYEHDFGFCRHRVGIRCQYIGRLYTDEVMGKAECWEECKVNKQENGIRRVEFYRHLFYRSFFNVFISPIQAEIHQRVLGDILKPFHLLTPPIDANHFKIDKTAERDPNLVVSMTGKIDFWNKGMINIANYARQHPNLTFEVYTRSSPQSDIVLRMIENIKIMDAIFYEAIPAAYNRASYVIHLPQGIEPAGRTPVEGFLCGCEPIISEKVGIHGFKFKWNKYEETRERIIQGPYKFWRVVEDEYNRRYC